MNTVDIVNPDLERLYCPFCGTQTPWDGWENPCRHLVFVGSSEDVDTPAFSRDGLEWDPDADDYPGDDLIVRLGKQYPHSDYVCFLLSSPPPAGLEVYVVYKHTEISD
jgi:hypothetical protein